MVARALLEGYSGLTNTVVLPNFGALHAVCCGIISKPHTLASPAQDLYSGS
jgi:hypothetical protein